MNSERVIQRMGQFLHNYLYMEPYTDAHTHCCSISHLSDNHCLGNTPRNIFFLLQGYCLDTLLALVYLSSVCVTAYQRMLNDFLY